MLTAYLSRVWLEHKCTTCWHWTTGRVYSKAPRFGFNFKDRTFSVGTEIFLTDKTATFTKRPDQACIRPSLKIAVIKRHKRLKRCTWPLYHSPCGSGGCQEVVKWKRKRHAKRWLNLCKFELNIRQQNWLPVVVVVAAVVCKKLIASIVHVADLLAMWHFSVQVHGYVTKTQTALG